MNVPEICKFVNFVKQINSCACPYLINCNLWEKEKTETETKHSSENTEVTVVHLDSGCTEASDTHFIFSDLSQNKPILKLKTYV